MKKAIIQMVGHNGRIRNNRYDVSRVYVTDETSPDVVNKYLSGLPVPNILVVTDALKYQLGEGIAYSFDASKAKVKMLGGYQALFIEELEVEPYSEKGVLTFLQAIDGIGEVTAKKIYEDAGNQAVDWAFQEPEKFLKLVERHANARSYKMASEYIENKIGPEALMKRLLELGITSQSQAVRIALEIYDEMGKEAIEIIDRNPYAIAPIRGVGLKTADVIAKKLGLFERPNIEANRLTAAFLCALNTYLARTPSVYVEYHKALSRAGNLYIENTPNLTMSTKEIGRNLVQISKILHKNEIVRMERNFEGQLIITSSNNYLAEAQIADTIKIRVSNKTSAELLEDIEMLVSLEEEQAGYQLHKNQREAVINAIAEDFSIITGGPGTGKTTVLDTLIKVYAKLYPENEVLLMAPTGKAARKMSDSTGLPASTIHRALRLDPKGHSVAEEVDADLIVVDEASMIGQDLMNHILFSVKPTCKVVLVGDRDQLPSISRGEVLKDLIESSEVPCVELTKVYRQNPGGGVSTIVANAQKINRGDLDLEYDDSFVFIPAETPEEALQLIERTFIKYRRGYYPNSLAQQDVQVLTPIRKNPEIGSDAISTRIQSKRLRKKDNFIVDNKRRQVYMVGDAVMQMRNQRMGDDVLTNGDVGVIESIKWVAKDKAILTIDFYGFGKATLYSDNLDLSLAYATTVHKSQGSEYEVAIINIMDNNSHRAMLNRKLLYTAVTRAKKKVIIIGSKKALDECILNDSEERRITRLSERLKN